MRPFRIRALTALLSVTLMLFAAVPASADPGDGGATPNHSRSWNSEQKNADPGDGGATSIVDPGDGGALSVDPGDGGVLSDPGDGGGVSD